MTTKPSSNFCSKKKSEAIRSRSNKLKCETHGEVYCREPCVKFRSTISNKPEMSQNRKPRSVRQVVGHRLSDNEIGDNEVINLKPKVSSSSEMNQSRHPQKITRPANHVLDESIDTIPTRLYQDKQRDKCKDVTSKISSKNELPSASSKQSSLGVKRTTWDCILREQNIDLVANKSKTFSRLKDCDKKSTARPTSPHKSRLKDQCKASHITKSKPSHSGQTNKIVEIGQNYECASCSHNTRATENVGINPVYSGTQCLSGISHISKLPSQVKFNSNVSAHSFCPSKTNPVLTLDLLVKELRDKIQRQVDDDDLQRIILDMENALSNFPSLPDHQNEKRNNQIAEPEKFKSALKQKLDIAECKSVEQLHLKLEQSCQFLQEVYEQLHENGKKHREEKERLTLNLVECRRLLAISKSKEKEHEATIKELRFSLQDRNNKADQHVQAIHELTQVISRLQEENKCLAPLQASHAKLTTKYHETVTEKEKLNSELQLLKMEKEKLTVLMEVKDSELEKMKKNFEDIKTMFGNHLINLETAKEPDNLNLNSTVSSVYDKESDEQFRPICSSPTSSIPGSSPTPYNSWQVISSIAQKPRATVELKQGIKDLFAEMKKQTKELNPNKLLPDINYGSEISDSNDEDGLQFKSIPKLDIPSDILESDLSS